MKKSLLLMAGIGLGMSVHAQVNDLLKVVHSPKQNVKLESTVADYNTPVNVSKAPVLKNGALLRSAGIERLKIGSSFNFLTAIVSESNCLTADQNLNLVSFIHRQDNGNPGGAGKSGYVMNTFSTDGGKTFPNKILVATFDSSGGKTAFTRYPSGSIINPAGNKDPMKAVSAVSGPVTGGSGWQGYYYASSRLDGTSKKQEYFDNADPMAVYQSFPRLSAQSTDNGYTHVLGADYDANTTGAEINALIINNGKLNASTNQVDWTTTRINHGFAKDTANSKLISNLGSLAFSQDGLTGYMAVLGRDSVTDVLAIQPIVYKTVDGGTTWNQMPIFDFKSVPVFNTMLPKTNRGDVKPYFSSSQGWDMAVDKNNNLHIFSLVHGTSSYDPDSLGFGFFNLRLMFDTYTTANGWDARFIDTLKAADVPATSSLWSTLALDARMQMSRTMDGSKLVYTWLDTDPSFDATNLYPDIKGQAYDLGKSFATKTKNFTLGTNFDAQNYFLYASNVALTVGDKLVVPCTVSDSQNATRGDGTDPADHFYVSGIEYTPQDFGAPAAVNELERGALKISQNYPNPFNNETSIDVVLASPSKVTLTVTNLVGQKVFETDANVGTTHSFKVSKNNMTPGVYFYTVKSATEAITNKMIVE